MEGGNQKILAPTRTEQGILYVRRADGRGELKDRSTHENRSEQNKASYTHEIRTSILYVRRTYGRGEPRDLSTHENRINILCQENRGGGPSDISTHESRTRYLIFQENRWEGGGAKGPCTQDNICKGEKGIFVPRRTDGQKYAMQ